VIRDVFLTPLARAVRRGRLGAAGEYLLYLLGWGCWLLEWLARIPHIASDASASAAPRRVRVWGAPLLRGATEPSAASARARAVLAEAGTLLAPLGLSVDVEDVQPVRIPDGMPPPACGPAALFGRFFAWASGRAAEAPRLTVYFVEDMRPLAGCAVPGTDWIVVDLRTDGTTVVHEMGHLADLWRHHPDPANVMTDRAGGSHDRITRFQAAMIRTSRFAVPITPPPPRRGGS
jgi:hypothetical protein